MQRQEGYYWVMHAGMWVVALYIPGNRPEWRFHSGVGSVESILYDDTHFFEINETRILSPEEGNTVFAGNWATERGTMEPIYITLPKGVTMEHFMSAVQHLGATSPEAKALELLGKIRNKKG